ncbi:uncharacterized protein LOC102349713 [Latimeria chalumnae]|uniref:uncharacterized protein LOC102349713 n=1 Tax=Latimeria chalumnae TaxID=7897 RepID=UPI0006D940EC|nr:PREDICTED: uncharacterized protein LOC102349713 [Latimeria chalumnae]|eukprot:XP_014339290.1 PREDICTED: uncharacterized protein LOC102349713 [Latimeria chalumnae]
MASKPSWIQQHFGPLFLCLYREEQASHKPVRQESNVTSNEVGITISVIKNCSAGPSVKITPSGNTIPVQVECVRKIKYRVSDANIPTVTFRRKPWRIMIVEPINSITYTRKPKSNGSVQHFVSDAITSWPVEEQPKPEISQDQDLIVEMAKEAERRSFTPLPPESIPEDVLKVTTVHCFMKPATRASKHKMRFPFFLLRRWKREVIERRRNMENG